MVGCVTRPVERLRLRHGHWCYHQSPLNVQNESEVVAHACIPNAIENPEIRVLEAGATDPR